jgi:hypothetical protein
MSRHKVSFFFASGAAKANLKRERVADRYVLLFDK